MEEFIRANCEYPGDWTGQVEKEIRAEDTIITATHVASTDGSISCHVISFFQVKDGKAPQWRLDMHIGVEIKEC